MRADGSRGVGGRPAGRGAARVGSGGRAASWAIATATSASSPSGVSGAREHLVDDDALLVVQAQDEIHQATAGAGRSVPMFSAWTATPTSIPAAATRKTPLGPWAPAIAPPAAAPTAMPTVSPAVCRL